MYRLKRSNGSIRDNLTEADLRSLAKLGEIRSSDMIAREGDDRWTSATKIKGLAVTDDRINCTTTSVPTKPYATERKAGRRELVQECRHFVPLIESVAGQGSGLLVSNNGLIVTNRHVIEDGRVFMINLYDGTKTKAVVIHQNNTCDLAVIKAALNTKSYFDLPDRISEGFDAGDEVIAIGHPRGLTFTSTRGIISEPRRRLPDGVFVQTDVAINPGNSGGPLLDEMGNLVGLNTQIQRDSQGLGFAISGQVVADYVAEVRSLIRSGKIRVPSDEELSELEEVLSPTELLEAAMRSTEFAYEPSQHKDWHGWHIHTPLGSTFAASANDQAFILTHCVADLTEEQQEDAPFLYQLLRWQDDLTLVRFTIDDDNTLFLAYSRSSEDLDISEILVALYTMAEAIDTLSDSVRRYIGD